MVYTSDSEYLYTDWVPLISASSFENVTWIFSPGHAGVRGNERADSLAGDAAIDGNLTYCYPVCIRPADSKQTAILLPHPFPPEREGSQAWRRCHLQQQGRDASPSEPTSDGDSEPPDAEIQPDDEGRAGMGVPRLPRLRRRLQVITGNN